MPDWVWYLLGFGALVVAVYILVRFGSIAHYRTRAEFEQGSFRKPMNGENDGNER
jgi:hypothetical protein